MRISELIDQLTDQLQEWGDVPVVKHSGYGTSITQVFWDADENDETVVVIS